MNVASPVGAWGVEGDEQGIARIYLPGEKGPASRGTPPKCVADGAAQLEEFLRGERRSFRLKLRDVEATPFQHEVWRALCDIPFGEVRTYTEVASAVHRPKAARAVGNANHANPWPIVVPCHRVVAAAGLGGYGGGERVKRYLLGLEGITYD